MNKVIAILMLVSTSAFADISGHIGYSSDYVFRGVNQTTESGALSLSLEAESNGFYTGIWASEVDFGDIVSYEYDYYVGFAFALTQNVSVDLVFYREIQEVQLQLFPFFELENIKRLLFLPIH